MKEIKFRAWNGEYMCYSPTLFKKETRSGCVQFATDDGSSSLELMQYTGLKDKNGKEIYEGDILSFGEKEWVIKVEFLDGMFGAYEPMSAHWQDLAYWVYGAEIDCSVIGNIYENPELLERP